MIGRINARFVDVATQQGPKSLCNFRDFESIAKSRFRAAAVMEQASNENKILVASRITETKLVVKKEKLRPE